MRRCLQYSFTIKYSSLLYCKKKALSASHPNDFFFKEERILSIRLGSKKHYPCIVLWWYSRWDVLLFLLDKFYPTLANPVLWPSLLEVCTFFLICVVEAGRHKCFKDDNDGISSNLLPIPHHHHHHLWSHSPAWTASSKWWCSEKSAIFLGRVYFASYVCDLENNASISSHWVTPCWNYQAPGQMLSMLCHKQD